MAITWGAWSSGYSNNARLGHEYSVSGVTIYINTWLEFQYSVNDAQTLHFSSATGSWGGSVNYTKNGPSAQMIHSYSVNGSRGGNYHFGNYLSGVYNGANPSIDTWVNVPYANPSTPGHPSVSEVTATSALLHSGGVADNGGAPIDNWRYQVSNTPSFGGYVDWGGSPWRITGLTRATHYYFRTLVRNSANYWSDWSSVGEFDTLPTKPGKENTPSITEVTASSFKVTYTGNADGGGLPITANQVQVSTNNSFTALVYDGQPANNTTITGLASAQTYYVRVRAYNAYGWSDSWSDAAQTTTAATVPGQVGGFALSSTSQSGAVVSWAAPSNGGSAITGYTLQIATNTGFTTGLQTISASGTGYTLTGLTPGTQYYARVRANNAVGNGAYSTTLPFTTVSGKPQIVSDVAGLEFTRTSGLMGAGVFAQGWAGNFTITVQVSLVDTFAATIKTLTLSPSATTPNFRYAVQDTVIQADGVYYVRARVKNNTTAYESEWSDTATYSQSHLPVATAISPSGGGRSIWTATTPFTFRFSDSASPLDQMSAYELVVENVSTGVAVYSSGKTALATTGTNPSITRQIAIPAGSKNTNLRWRVRVWDSVDQVSSWSGYSVFSLGDAPVVTIVLPPDGVPVTTGAPEFRWTSVLAGTQAGWAVEVREQVSGAIAWEQSGVDLRSSAQPTSVVLQNGRAYQATIRITDSFGLVGSKTTSFTVTYVAPEPPSYEVIANTSYLEEFGHALIDWSYTPVDTYVVSWGVYRREVPSLEWELIANVTDAGQLSYKDWTGNSGSIYQYSITQRADRSGVILESPVGYRNPDPIFREVNQAINPSFESGTTGCTQTYGTGGAGALSNPTTGGRFGTRFARWTWTTASTAAAYVALGAANYRATITPGTVASVSVYVRPSVALSIRPVVVAWTLATAGTSTSINGAYVSCPANVWTKLELNGWTSTNGFIEVRAQTSAAVPINTTIDLDGVMVKVGSVAGDFFDGNSPMTTDRFAWSGAINLSPSYRMRAPQTEERSFELSYSDFWLIVPDDETLTTRLRSVISDDFADPYEQASSHVIGRGRHVDYGDRLGYTGTLVLQLRGETARETRLSLQRLRHAQSQLLLRSPFGDIFPVALGDPSTSRLAGTGNTEMSDYTMPWEEVYA